MNFCNLQIRGLGHCQSRDLGLAEKAGIPALKIPGLQSLVLCKLLIGAIQ